MQFRNRTNDQSVQHQGPPPAGPEGNNLDQIREAGESLFHAADDAIRRALSCDSRAFLEATQQSGGQ